MRVTTFALSFGAITIVSWRYLFIIPHRFLNGDYIMFDCGGMAFNEAGFHASITKVRLEDSNSQIGNQQSEIFNLKYFGAPAGIRTPNQQIMSLLL